MTMTTPNEFLQFAQDMGLGQMKTARHASSSSSSTTGLSVLNNLCRLIEQMHLLRADNDRLRAQLELVARVDKFHEHYAGHDASEDRAGGHEHTFASISTYDEDKPTALSPTNSWKIKHLPPNRSHRGNERCVLHESHGLSDATIDKDVFLQLLSAHRSRHRQPSRRVSHGSRSDRRQPSALSRYAETCIRLITTLSARPLGSSAAVSWHKWSKVRDALRLSLRRKPDSTSSPPLIHVDKPIPMISISIESDDEHLPDRRNSKKAKKKTMATTLVRHEASAALIDDDSDHDDESMPLVRGQQRRRPDGHDAGHSSSTERQETWASNAACQSVTGIDDDPLLTRKQSKIGTYV